MASPQLEDGYTSVANELFEALAQFRMPGELNLLIYVIIRKTYGWHKKTDWISGTQFCELTGLNKGSVSRGLKSLDEHKVIIRGHKSITLNKNYSEWTPFGKLSKVQPKKVIKSATKVIKSDNKKLSKVQDTKEKKETNTKESDSIFLDEYDFDAVAWLLDYVQSSFELPHLDDSLKNNKDNASMLLKSYGREQVKRIVDVAAKDNWYRNNCTSIKRLANNAARILASQRGPINQQVYNVEFPVIPDISDEDRIKNLAKVKAKRKEMGI